GFGVLVHVLVVVLGFGFSSISGPRVAHLPIFEYENEYRPFGTEYAYEWKIKASTFSYACTQRLQILQPRGEDLHFLPHHPSSAGQCVIGIEKIFLDRSTGSDGGEDGLDVGFRVEIDRQLGLEVLQQVVVVALLED